MSIDHKRLIKILSDRDVIIFIFLLMVILGLATPLMDMMTRSWKTESMGQISGAIRDIDPNGVSAIMAFTIGFYIISSILLFKDRYKKVQGAILLAGIFIVFIYIYTKFDIDWTIMHIVYALIGIAVGLFVGKVQDVNKKDDVTFEHVAKNVGIVSVIYIVIIYLNVHLLSNDQNIYFIKDTIVSLAFALVFNMMMNYEVKGPEIFILGPKASGKTLLLVGCYMAAQNDKRAYKPHTNLSKAYTELISKSKTEEEIMLRKAKYDSEKSSETMTKFVETIEKEKLTGKEWLSQTLYPTEYDFIYIGGSIFPKKVMFRTMDHPGPWLQYFSNYLVTGNIHPDVDEEEFKKVIDQIMKTDKLIFVIDYDRNPNFIEVADYVTIITNLRELHETRKDGKGVKSYIVVTKSDILRDIFVETKGRPPENYDIFKEFVDPEIVHNQFIEMLQANTFDAPIYPVFYFTRIDITGKRVPIRDERTLKIYTYGFDILTNDLSS